jgi:glycosyltransferase involved in cell wall biosynthesis
MNKKPLISVIIPVYNVEKYLNTCLQSIINQTYKNIEIIIINDGSTDNSLTICEKYKSKDSRIILFTQENKGVSASRNLGIDNATGSWINFVDGDDFLDLETYENLTKLINNEIDVIQFGVRAIKNNIVFKEKHCQKLLEISDLNKSLKFVSSAWNNLIKFDLIKQNNLYFVDNMKYNEDMLFMYQVFINAKKSIINDKIYYNQVVSENSASRSPVSRILIDNRLELIDRLIDYSKDKKLLHEMKEVINSLLKGYFVSILHYRFFLKELCSIQTCYNKFFKKNKDIIDSLFAKIAYINIIPIVVFIKIKNLIKLCNY